MYFDLRTFLKAEYIALFRRRFSARRWFYVIVFTWLFFGFWWLNVTGRLLDYVFFPGFRKQEVREPVFIIATPRSGTTLTHRLMSLDEERFTYYKLYQTLFPSVFGQRVFDALGWIDRRIGRPLSRIVGWLERRSFRGWKDVHAMGFSRAEEDEGVFLFTALSPGIYLLFPYVEELRGAGFADELPARKRRRLMSYYRSSLQRHLYASGRGRTFLNKNTLFSGRIESVLETFPDARIVYLLRHPDEAIPSLVSMFYLAWRAHSRDIAKDAPEPRAFAQLAVDYYLHMLKHRDKFEPDRYIDLRYTDLVANPKGTIERIYDHFGMEMSDAFKARLEAATQKSRRYKSSHEYSLEEYGLSKEWVRERLDELFDVYGFER